MHMDDLFSVMAPKPPTGIIRAMMCAPCAGQGYYGAAEGLADDDLSFLSIFPPSNVFFTSGEMHARSVSTAIHQHFCSNHQSVENGGQARPGQALQSHASPFVPMSWHRAQGMDAAWTPAPSAVPRWIEAVLAASCPGKEKEIVPGHDESYFRAFKNRPAIFLALWYVEPASLLQCERGKGTTVVFLSPAFSELAPVRGAWGCVQKNKNYLEFQDHFKICPVALYGKGEWRRPSYWQNNAASHPGEGRGGEGGE